MLPLRRPRSFCLAHTLGGRHIRIGDLDFLVVEPEVANEAEESVRLHRALRDLRVPASVIVLSRDYVDRWRDVRGGLVHAVLSKGRVLVG